MVKLDFHIIYLEKCHNRGVRHFELKHFDVIVTCALNHEITLRPIQPMLNQRTNGPVNAHLRSAVYTNVIENSPSIGADEALGPFFFSE